MRSVVKLKNVDDVCRGKGNNRIFGKIGLLFDIGENTECSTGQWS